MQRLKDNIKALLVQNYTIFCDFDDVEPIIMASGPMSGDYNEPFSHLFLKSVKDEDESVSFKHMLRKIEFTEYNRFLLDAIFTIGDSSTYKWLTSKPDTLFEGLDVLGWATLNTEISDYDLNFTTANEWKIRLYAGVDFDEDKVNVFNSYLEYYLNFDRNNVERELIIEGLFKIIRNDVAKGQNHSEQMYDWLIASKMANDPVLFMQQYLNP